jgi:LPXTG-motif cell wall-anchored protein
VLQGIAANGTNITLTVPIRVVAGGAAAAPGGSGNSGGVGGVQLPVTGAEIATVSAAGIALIGLGSIAVTTGRRRRISA